MYRIVYFPFDTQACGFFFLPENQLQEQVDIYPDQPLFGSELASNQWELIGMAQNSYTYGGLDYFVENRPKCNYSAAIICIFLRRDPTYYIITLILPSTLLCVMSFVTFLAPPDSGERISLGVSMVLGLTVFQLLVAETLPKVSKDSPILSTYLSANFIIASLAIPLSLFNINITYEDTKLSSLKVPWVRRTFLEILPSLLLVTPYSERLRGEIIGDMEENPRLDVAKEEEKEVCLDEGQERKTFRKVNINKVVPAVEPHGNYTTMTHSEKVSVI